MSQEYQVTATIGQQKFYACSNGQAIECSDVPGFERYPSPTGKVYQTPNRREATCFAQELRSRSPWCETKVNWQVTPAKDK